jgi:D-alanine-D-alanine ligase
MACSHSFFGRNSCFCEAGSERACCARKSGHHSPMKRTTVGLTFDLRRHYLDRGFSEEETAEFDSADTINAIAGALQKAGFNTVAIGNVWALTERLAAGERWDFVFNIAEGLSGLGREAQVPCLLDAYQIPYTFSEPLALTATLHKATTKRLLRDLGLPTPDFALVETEDDLQNVELDFPLFVKPVAEGTSKGITADCRVCGRMELENVCLRLVEKFGQAVLVEEFLPGREFTVGMLGTGAAAQVLGVMEILLGPEAEPLVYSYINKAQYEELVRYRLATDDTANRAAEIALAAWRGLGCRDAGRIDLRCDRNGEVNLIEINPLPGLHPTRSDLCILSRMAGIGYQELIDGIMRSALQRTRLGVASPPKRAVVREA